MVFFELKFVQAILETAISTLTPAAANLECSRRGSGDGPALLRSLPEEMIASILCFLPPRNVLHFAQCSRRCGSVAFSDAVWRSLYRDIFWPEFRHATPGGCDDYARLISSLMTGHNLTGQTRPTPPDVPPLRSKTLSFRELYRAVTTIPRPTAGWLFSSTVLADHYGSATLKPKESEGGWWSCMCLSRDKPPVELEWCEKDGPGFLSLQSGQLQTNTPPWRDSFSLSFWVIEDKEAKYCHGILRFHNGAQHVAFLLNNGNLVLDFTAADENQFNAVLCAIPRDNEWHRICVVVYKPPGGVEYQLFVYCDSQLKQKTTFPELFEDCDDYSDTWDELKGGKLAIGNEHAMNSSMPLWLRHVCWWDRALTPAQVRALFWLGPRRY
eukprot:TRINITY_DN30800_c0_g1_i1.p1 TRINITY_DN30800_c0_g1~~TRINITY_DN30800_c0_g1_i1.p1  ORF type:complete len:391 (+),score=50.72 TRINITY_DN30800_c0_g1_i1:25-1173(+)